jgi:hypothetical protein
MKFARWKPYGFTHIVKGETSDVDLPNYGKAVRGKTLCGFGFSVMTEWHPHLADRMSSLSLLMAEEDDGKRPLCGSCKKIAKL